MSRTLPFVVLLLAFLGIVGYVGFSFYRDLKGPELPNDPNVAKLVTDLKGWDAKTRLTAVDRLGDMGSEGVAAVPHLVHALRKGDDEMRIVTTMALGRMGKDALPPLLKAMDDSDPSVRHHAVWAVGLMGPEAAEPAGAAVVGLLGDANEDVRRKAAESLGRMGPDVKDAVPALAKALGDSSEDVQLAAVDALGRYGTSGAKELRGALGSKPEIRRRAIQALGKMHDSADEVAPALVALLKTKGSGEGGNLQWEVTQALTSLGKGAIPALTAALKDPDGATRTQSVHALAQMGTDGAAVLADALKSEQLDVRRLAAQHLGGLGVGDKLIVLGLAAALKDEDRTVRLNAAYSLSNLGPAAHAALPALEEAADGDDRELKAAVRPAIQRIRPR
jgi:HEAT repeat protein